LRRLARRVWHDARRDVGASRYSSVYSSVDEDTKYDSYTSCGVGFGGLSDALVVPLHRLTPHDWSPVHALKHSIPRSPRSPANEKRSFQTPMDFVVEWMNASGSKSSDFHAADVTTPDRNWASTDGLVSLARGTAGSQDHGAHPCVFQNYAAARACASRNTRSGGGGINQTTELIPLHSYVMAARRLSQGSLTTPPPLARGPVVARE